MWFLVPAIAIAICNFYLSFARPFFRKFRYGSLKNMQGASALPGIGTVLVVVGGVVGFGASSAALLGLVALVCDTGGSLWFLAATWRDTSFWDAG